MGLLPTTFSVCIRSAVHVHDKNIFGLLFGMSGLAIQKSKTNRCNAAFCLVLNTEGFLKDVTSVVLVLVMTFIPLPL